MALTCALPREADRTDMRYRWIARVLGNDPVDPDAVMAPFAAEVLGRAAADRRGIVPILDQSKVSDRHRVPMLAVRHGERALPLAWRVETTEGAIGFEVQKALLDAVASWMPEGVEVCPMGDRFHGTADLISPCQGRGWSDRLRLEGRLVVKDRSGRTTTAARAEGEIRYLEDVELRVCECIELMPECPLKTLTKISSFSTRRAFIHKLSRRGAPRRTSASRGFGVENTQIQYPDRLARLPLVMALALYGAVSTGLWDDVNHPTPAEKKVRSASLPKWRGPECPGSPGG